MDLYNAIFQRKATRKFDMQPLPSEVFSEIESAISGFARLYPEVELEYRFTDKTRGMFGIAAPHYLIISGSGAAFELEAAGFLFQHLDLWLSAKGLGSIWLAGAKDANKDNPNDIVTLAFGRAQGSPHRSLAEFSRKSISEISNVADDPCIQAVRLAPSGMNSQPWFFKKEADSVSVYEKKPKGPSALIYKLTDFDLGIALCHYAVTAEHNGLPFAFTRTDSLPELEGFIPFGIIA
ncbi:MAG: hypothetical protein LBU61_02300 [Coriobacteriales bacterium]|jgi:nitroreductase|nr:hypothetical protein [Coriobacteriales bacterium]